MPKSASRKAPGSVALDKESLSSATQLSHFSVRTAKFTHDVAVDGNADFASGYSLPDAAFILSVCASVETPYDGTGTATLAGESLTLTAAAVVGGSTPAAATGELTLDFTANDSTVGKATFAVTYVDLTELK